jgi:RNA polymerase sigma factor (sigma-70 family)
MTETARLIRYCLKGDVTAQKQLYDSYAPAMLAVCYRYTKSLDDAQDVLQEGFIKVFKNLHQFRGEGQLGGWIRMIMVNAALAYLKQNRKYQSDMLMMDDHLHPVSNDNPVVELEAKDLSNLVRQLPAGYQTIFNLHAVEGYSHVEIAGMLGINESTSRSQYMRARNLLINWIEKFSKENKLSNYA